MAACRAITGSDSSLGPVIAALLFVLIMSRVPEPARRHFNAILVAGTCGAYLGGRFGIWELAYPLLATPVVYARLRTYRFLGIAWLMHAGDLAHHLWGNPIWPFMPTSSWGCTIFDSGVAIWFLAGAPALIQHIWPSGVRAYSPIEPKRSS
jgi:hypothetical protein